MKKDYNTPKATILSFSTASLIALSADTNTSDVMKPNEEAGAKSSYFFYDDDEEE